jgi:hypothetical protein
VEKKNGKLRICIDFGDLNRATTKDEYPMPLTNLLVDATFGHKITNFMDNNAGYSQIFMVDITKTSFRCTGSIDLYEWIIMTFDLKNVGAIYQWAMNYYMFHDLLGRIVKIYIDDAIMKSKGVKEHLSDLREVLERTRKYGLKMKPHKCVFGVLAS